MTSRPCVLYCEFILVGNFFELASWKINAMCHVLGIEIWKYFAHVNERDGIRPTRLFRVPIHTSLTQQHYTTHTTIHSHCTENASGCYFPCKMIHKSGYKGRNNTTWTWVLIIHAPTPVVGTGTGTNLPYLQNAHVEWSELLHVVQQGNRTHLNPLDSMGMQFFGHCSFGLKRTINQIISRSNQYQLPNQSITVSIVSRSIGHIFIYPIIRYSKKSLSTQHPSIILVISNQ